MKKIIGQPTQTNSKLIELIKKTKINNYYIKNQEDFRKRKDVLQYPLGIHG